MPKTVLVLCLYCLLSGVLVAGDVPFQRSVEVEGIAVDFLIEQIDPARKNAVPTSGDHVNVRFHIYDTATGSPVTGAYPAAWMDLLPSREMTNSEMCKGKIKRFAGGSLFSRAELDLNVYYVLAMNQDATLTVVDPLFGFGGSKLLALIPLLSPGLDWTTTEDQNSLFVSMPAANRVARIDTRLWRVMENLDVGEDPAHVALQRDGAFLWVTRGGLGEDAGVTVVNMASGREAARLTTGKGPHQLAFDPHDRYAYVANAGSGTVSVIDIRSLKIIKQIPTGPKPVAVAFSQLSGALYVADEVTGTITTLDGGNHEIIGSVTTHPGIRLFDFAPGGRYGFGVNPSNDFIYILDVATGRIVQKGTVHSQPVHLAFSNELAYIGHANHEDVLMVPLAEIGKEETPIQVIDFVGGQNPMGKVSTPSLAPAIVRASGESAVLVANPSDEAIYFYKEGMAAPMGNFVNYSREPRAVCVIERNLREKSPGMYETDVILRREGPYDVAFFLDSPRIIHCFEMELAPNPDRPSPDREPPLKVAFEKGKDQQKQGEPFELRFQLMDRKSGALVPGLRDVMVLLVKTGNWQRRAKAHDLGDGSYSVTLKAVKSGYHALYVNVPSRQFQAGGPLGINVLTVQGEN